jgi:hypothetical protein
MAMMMMMHLTSSLWHASKDRLSAMKLEANEFHYVRIDESSIIPSYCGVDSDGLLFLAFRCARRPQIPEVNLSSFDSFSSQRPDKTWLYILRLIDQKLVSVFDALCIDLINEVSTTQNEDDFARLLKRRVKLWQKLFTNSNDGLLKRSQIIGLIGELLFLIDLIQTDGIPLEMAISSWQGPYGANQDFIFNNSAVEIKTNRDDLDEISISSVEQLNTDRFSSIKLVNFGYRDVAQGDINGVSLNSLSARVAALCEKEPFLLREFNSALLEAGYVFNDLYDQINISIIRKDAYDIAGNFPRIIPSHIELGITEVRYKISLIFISSFKLTPYPYGN